MIRKTPVILLFLFVSLALPAQERYRIGILPQVNLNLKLSDSWRLNARAETRQVVAEGWFGDPFGFNYDNNLTDLSLQASRRMAGNQNLSFGYLIRLTGETPAHRAIQQYSVVSGHRTFRLGHRFAADQTFEQDEPVEYRFRYRIGFEKALSGQTVDPGEFYVKINQEQLHGFSDGEYDLELRLSPAVGYEFTDNNKLETGIDSRFSSFLDGGLRSTLWLSIGWFISF
jgi:hypothetical protein